MQGLQALGNGQFGSKIKIAKKYRKRLQKNNKVVPRKKTAPKKG